MEISIQYPSLHLRPYVEFYKTISCDNLVGSMPTLTGYPGGFTDMVIALEGVPNIQYNGGELQELKGIFLIGHFEQNFTAQIDASTEIIWVRMKPHGIFALTGIPAKSFYNGCISVQDIFNSSGGTLLEALQASRDVNDRIKLLESFLYRKIEQSYIVDQRLEYIIGKMIEEKGKVKLKNLCLELGCNYRSLDRLFWNKVGESPKRMLQNIRFKNILEDIGGRQYLDWMQLVADYGFHDQAHFIKEFQKYTDQTPGTFLDSMNEIGKGLFE